MQRIRLLRRRQLLNLRKRRPLQVSVLQALSLSAFPHIAVWPRGSVNSECRRSRWSICWYSFYQRSGHVGCGAHTNHVQDAAAKTYRSRAEEAGVAVVISLNQKYTASEDPEVHCVFLRTRTPSSWSGRARPARGTALQGVPARLSRGVRLQGVACMGFGAMLSRVGLGLLKQFGGKPVDGMKLTCGPSTETEPEVTSDGLGFPSASAG